MAMTVKEMGAVVPRGWRSLPFSSLRDFHGSLGLVRLFSGGIHQDRNLARYSPAIALSWRQQNSVEFTQHEIADRMRCRNWWQNPARKLIL